MVNGHATGTEKKMELPTIYVWPIFEAYAREYPHKIGPNIWYVYVPPFEKGPEKLTGRVPNLGKLLSLTNLVS